MLLERWRTSMHADTAATLRAFLDDVEDLAIAGIRVATSSDEGCSQEEIADKTELRDRALELFPDL